jgi:hypothetical protein
VLLLLINADVTKYHNDALEHDNLITSTLVLAYTVLSVLSLMLCSDGATGHLLCEIQQLLLLLSTVLNLIVFMTF